MSGNLQNNNKSYKVILIGSSAIGKTSLCNNIQKKDFNTDMPITIGVDFITLELTDYDEFAQFQNTYNIYLWDTAGHEKFSAITKSYYRNSHIVLLCFDLTSRTSFIELNKWIEDIKSIIETPHCIYLMGLKSDLKSVINDNEINDFLNKYLITSFHRFSSKDDKNSNNIKNILINAIKKYETLIEELEYVRNLSISKLKLDNDIMNPVTIKEDTRLNNIKYCC
jgi:small GTP-binding protein